MSVKTETKQELYFKKYRYRVSFYLLGATKTNYNKDMSSLLSSYSQSQIDSIINLINFKAKHLKCNYPLKNDVAVFVGYGDNIRVFFNDLAIVNELAAIDAVDYKMTEINLVSAPFGVKLFSRTPKFKYRVYLKEKRVDDEWKKEFLNFLKSQSGLTPCPALLVFLKDARPGYRYRFLSSSHFIEYDDDRNRLLLLLYAGEKYIGRQFELKQRCEINTI